jgi:dUTPase
MSIKGRSKAIRIHAVKIVMLAVDMDYRDELPVLLFQHGVPVNKAFFDIKL